MDNTKEFLLDYWRAYYQNSEGNFTIYKETEDEIRFKFEDKAEITHSHKFILKYLSKKYKTLKKQLTSQVTVYGETKEEIFTSITREVFSESGKKYITNQLQIMKYYINQNRGDIMETFNDFLGEDLSDTEIDRLIHNTATLLITKKD